MSRVIALIDYDSMIYMSCYKIVSIQDIKQWIKQNQTREWMEAEILNKSINRLCNMGDKLLESVESSTEIQENGFEIMFCEYFITQCKTPIRNIYYGDYKQNRTKNPMKKWVNKVRNYLLESEFSCHSNEWEADDLIYDRAKELGQNECIILSIDKDLKQIPGMHFSFYKKPSKELDQNGNRIQNPMKGFFTVSKEESNYNLWLSMLTGDSTDNIKGIPGIGPKKAANIIDGVDYEDAVRESYLKAFGEGWEIEFEKNYLMLKLGVREIPKILANAKV
ncbi:MAG: hypothetical protein WAT92_00380 [Saprospiraceae bacterium]